MGSVKQKSDIDLVAKYAPIPQCDTEEVNRQAEAFGERRLVRGFIPMFDVYGQSVCWQDAAVLYGIEKLILETFDDPEWVHTLKNAKGRPPMLRGRRRESVSIVNDNSSKYEYNSYLQTPS